VCKPKTGLSFFDYRKRMREKGHGKAFYARFFNVASLAGAVPVDVRSYVQIMPLDMTWPMKLTQSLTRSLRVSLTEVQKPVRGVKIDKRTHLTEVH
jgi:hypothetical protein